MIFWIFVFFFIIPARLLNFPISSTSKKHKNENENNSEINNNDENNIQNLKDDRSFQIRQISSSLDEKIGFAVSQLFGKRYHELYWKNAFYFYYYYYYFDFNFDFNFNISFNFHFNFDFNLI